MPITPYLRRPAVLAVAIVAAAGLAACSGSSTPKSTSSGAPAAGKPISGGTLRVIADSGPDELDPVPAYNYTSYELERGYARQLVSYPTTSPTSTSGSAWVKSTTLVPDMATEVPSASNGGITKGGLVYAYHIKPGIDWSSSPPRQVTADDFIREFKAFCNPKAPVGNVTYYDSTIAGFATYCNAEDAHFGAKNAPAATAASVAAWQNSHTISGLSAPDPLTLQVRLAQPASDFNDIMSLPFVSARPVEYDKYLPDSAGLRQHMLSDGPYEISSYVPGKSITLSRNPAWKQSTDPLRHQYVDKLVETFGTSSEQTILTDLQAGSQDIEDAETGIPSQSLAGLMASHDKRLTIYPSSNDDPYLAFNLRSPNNGGAMKKLALRQAIEYGVDKAAVVKVGGGPALNIITNTAIPPGNAGYQPSSLYKTPGNAGDPAKCKSLVKSAGYPSGITLTMLYPNESGAATFFQVIQGALAKCGITLKGRPDTNFFTDVENTAQTGKPGTWDLTDDDWFPDWFGNNGRTTIQPLFQTNCQIGTTNVGCYSNPQVDHMIAQALMAPDEAAAAPLWHQVDVTVMKDAVIVPLTSSKNAIYASSRVHATTGGTSNFNTLLQSWDFTNLYLDPNTP